MLASIKSFLDKQVDIYEDKDILDHIHDEVPVIVGTMTSIKEYEGTVFLPDAVVSLLNSILKLNTSVRKLAVERFVKSKEFPANESEPKTEIFPSLPLHSRKKVFKADKGKTKVDEDECNKDYPKASKMTPGLAHIFCRHGICKGFTTMTTAENPEIFTKTASKRCPNQTQNIYLRQCMQSAQKCTEKRCTGYFQVSHFY